MMALSDEKEENRPPSGKEGSHKTTYTAGRSERVSLDSGVAQQRPSKTSLAQHPRSKHGGLCSLHLHLPATATGKTVLRTEGKEAEARVVARVLAILRACTGNLGTKRPSRGGVVSQGNGRGGGCRGTRVRDRVYNLPPVTLTYPRGGDPQPLKSLLDLSHA